MGFGGAAAAMIQSLRHNKRERTSRFDTKEKQFNATYGKLDDHTKMSPAAFQAFKEKLQEEARLKRFQFYSIYGVVMAILIGVGVYYLFFK